MTKKISAGLVHKVPADLQKILISDPKMLVAWEAITPLARNEWICWIISAKKIETRNHRMNRAQDNLKGGQEKTLLLGGLHSSLVFLII